MTRELFTDLPVVECDGARQCAVNLRLASPIAEIEKPSIVDSSLITPYGAVASSATASRTPRLRTSGGIGDSEYGGELAIFHDKKIVAIKTNSSSR